MTCKTYTVTVTADDKSDAREIIAQLDDDDFVETDVSHAEMAEALRLVRDDLAHYVSAHGPGPDARLAVIDSILSRLPVAK